MPNGVFFLRMLIRLLFLDSTYMQMDEHMPVCLKMFVIKKMVPSVY